MGFEMNKIIEEPIVKDSIGLYTSDIKNRYVYVFVFNWTEKRMQVKELCDLQED